MASNSDVSQITGAAPRERPYVSVGHELSALPGSLTHADTLHRQTAHAKNKQPTPGPIPTASPLLI